MKAVILIWLFIINIATYSQQFTGKITYRVSVESASPENISQKHIEAMFSDLDTVSILYLHGSRYKLVTLDSKTNTPKIISQYDSMSNKIFNYFLADSIPEMSSIQNNDLPPPINIARNKNETTVLLGKKCNSVTIDYGTSKTKIFFSNDSRVDTKTIRKDAPVFLQYINECNSLPLKIIWSSNAAVHNLVFTAKEISEEVLDKNTFNVPRVRK